MKRAFFTLLLVPALLLSSLTAAAQDPPTSLPEATAETANVGETGPQLETGGTSYSMEEFVGIVMQDTTVMWAGLFEVWGRPFVPPTFVTVEAGSYARSSCGINVGDPEENLNLTPALYCQYGGELGTQALDSSQIFENEFEFAPVIYLSLPWLENYGLASGTSGEVAISYRVVHEYSHHIQRLLGYIDHTGGGCCGYSDEQVELWAECLTGVWAHSAYDKGQLDSANIDAAQNAAWGEDADPLEEFGRDGSYGTQEQRSRLFMTGYESGNAGACFGDDGGT